MKLRRYWFEFEHYISISDFPGITIGYGVTAYSYEDAVKLLSERVFRDFSLPHIKKYVEDIDISTLDGTHVIPNMDVPTLRGIWFPRGYTF